MSLSRVVPIAVKLYNQVALPRNVFLSVGDVSFGLRQMLLPEGAIHRITKD